jgi:hypothetical protein
MKFSRTANLLRRLANWLSPFEYEKSAYTVATLDSDQEFERMNLEYYDNKEEVRDVAEEADYESPVGNAYKDRVVAKRNRIVKYLREEIKKDIEGKKEQQGFEQERKTEKGDYAIHPLPADPINLSKTVDGLEFDNKSKIHDGIKQDIPLEKEEVSIEEGKEQDRFNGLENKINYPPPKPWPKVGLPPEAKHVPTLEFRKDYASDLSDHPVIVKHPQEYAQQYVDGAISYITITPKKESSSGRMTPALGTPVFGPYSIDHVELDDAIKNGNSSKELRIVPTKEDRLESLVSREDLNEEEQKELQSLIGGREVIILRDAVLMEDG